MPATTSARRRADRPRCAGARRRRATDATSPATSSSAATPASATRCTTRCSARRLTACASRVLPRPPGPTIEVTRDVRSSARHRGDVVVPAEQRVGLVRRRRAGPRAPRPAAAAGARPAARRRGRCRARRAAPGGRRRTWPAPRPGRPSPPRTRSSSSRTSSSRGRSRGQLGQRARPPPRGGPAGTAPARGPAPATGTSTPAPPAARTPGRRARRRRRRPRPTAPDPPRRARARPRGRRRGHAARCAAALQQDGRGVDLVLGQRQPVAGRRAGDDVGAQLGPGPGDEDLQRLGRVLRLLVRPQPVDQPGGAAAGAQVAGEQREQAPQPGTGDLLAAVGHPRQQDQLSRHHRQGNQPAGGWHGPERPVLPRTMAADPVWSPRGGRAFTGTSG